MRDGLHRRREHQPHADCVIVNRRRPFVLRMGIGRSIEHAVHRLAHSLLAPRTPVQSAVAGSPIFDDAGHAELHVVQVAAVKQPSAWIIGGDIERRGLHRIEQHGVFGTPDT